MGTFPCWVGVRGSFLTWITHIIWSYMYRMYIDFLGIYVYHSKAEARCGLCPGRDGCPQGVTWAWQGRLSVLIQKLCVRSLKAQQGSDVALQQRNAPRHSLGARIWRNISWCFLRSWSCLRNLEQPLVTFGRWIRNLGLAALFADLTNTSQRIREEVWSLEGCHFKFQTLLLMDRQDCWTVVLRFSSGGCTAGKGSS